MAKNITLREAWSGEADCLHCPLRTSVLFAGLEEEDFESIHDPIDQFAIAPGTTLYHTGDSGDYLFTVRSGTLKLVQYLPDGGQRIVRLARVTDVIGLEILVGNHYEHDAIAIHRTEVCRYPAQVVRILGRKNPKLYRELMTRWQRALSEADAWLTELSTGSARRRVARLLLRLARDQTNGECELLSREDMGAILGITTETASRTVAEYKRRRLLVEADPNLFLLDIPSLRRISES
ncbi:MAG: Crp/Fnr family transcriptional regulator [Candidatus Thiosymbion ectosymbiont of Robbea hypermnestra]|nr:Crp/Fnr family transcriptional regulator [Candidatus Thiosymbion ectosymbiont of Robbea hypermnestra]